MLICILRLPAKTHCRYIVTYLSSSSPAHHHSHHNLTVQAGTMKQGTLPRNHLPVKAVIGVMGAAVRHISWSNIITNVICPFVSFNDGYGCEVQNSQKVLSVNVFKIRNNQKFSPYLRVPCCKPASWSSSISFGFWIWDVGMGMSLLAFLKSSLTIQN